MEFTRLTQLTGDKKYYDAVARIGNVFEASQNSTKLPGMWPVSINAAKPSFDEDNMFTLGGMSDSLYEYFPKQFLILGGLLSQPKTLYENFIEVAKKNLFFRFYNPNNEALLTSGDVRMSGDPVLKPYLAPRGQHLTCFAGGMVALASRIFNRPDDLKVADELTSGCVWAYDSMQNGIAAEIYSVMPCPKDSDCKWSEKVWHDAIAKANPSNGVAGEDEKKRIKTFISERRIPPGFLSIDDSRYILRPEAIESVFIMYRITGDQKWQDTAWRMFENIERISRTSIAASALWDITVASKEVKKMNSMESFWLAETLKYFYLCFQEFDVVSLDDFVLNTEAHPLRRPSK